MSTGIPAGLRSFQQALRGVREILGESPALVSRGGLDAESELILARAVQLATGRECSRAEIYASAADALPAGAPELALGFARDRARGKILQHILGVQTFLDHEYEVTPDVLVPRPETEVLVRAALERLDERVRWGFEIGLGSGAISTEILFSRPALSIRASEVSEAAAQVARRNAARVLGDAAAQARLEIRLAGQACEIWEAFGGEKAEFLISNPPYVAESDAIDEDVRIHEPALALFAPASDPLYFYRGISERVREFILPGGWIFLEIPSERARAIVAFFRGMSPALVADLNGRDRVLVARV